MTACLLYAKIHKNKAENLLHLMLYFSMSKCNCKKSSGGRGSGLKYFHEPTGRILQFDGPHPGNELYLYQVKMVKEFLQEVGEAE